MCYSACESVWIFSSAGTVGSVAGHFRHAVHSDSGWMQVGGVYEAYNNSFYFKCLELAVVCGGSTRRDRITQFLFLFCFSGRVAQGM